MNYSLSGGTAQPVTTWFTPADTLPSGETGAQPPPPSPAAESVEYDGGEWKPTRPWGLPQPVTVPAPCAHERTVEQLREWLSRQPFDGRVVVGDVLLRLGRRPSTAERLDAIGGE